MGGAIVAAAAVDVKARTPIVNQIGKDTLPELLGLLGKATVLVSPDSGPVHMATMVGLPVIGLYAATRTARAGPYYSRQWCVDKYDDAARKVFRRPSGSCSSRSSRKPSIFSRCGCSMASKRARRRAADN